MKRSEVLKVATFLSLITLSLITVGIASQAADLKQISGKVTMDYYFFLKTIHQVKILVGQRIVLV